MTALKWLIVLPLIGYLGGVGFLFFAQRSLVFPIPQRVRTAPQAVGFPAVEEHFLATADGEKIIIWHVQAKPGHAVILYFPGNGDFLAGSVGRLRDMTSDGTGLVAVSYRGYAGSSGEPSESGLLLDAEAAHAFTAARYSTDRMAVWGFSLGSGVAVALAAERPVGKLILEAPYSSIADVAASQFWFAPVRWLIKDPFRSDARIGHVTAPLLIMHGERDPAIPIKYGERLFTLAHEPKQFVRFPEGGHNDLDNYGAIGRVRQFIVASTG